MDRFIGVVIKLFIVAAIFGGLMFFFGKRTMDKSGSDESARIILQTVYALKAADIGTPIPKGSDAGQPPDWMALSELYKRSSDGLLRGASTFVQLESIPSVSTPAHSGERIFRQLGELDLELAGRAGAIYTATAEDADWFRQKERERIEIWNMVGKDVTKPLADVVIENPGQLAQRPSLSKDQLREVQLAFAGAVTGSRDTTPARLIDDFHWRLFGKGLFESR